LTAVLAPDAVSAAVPPHRGATAVRSAAAMVTAGPSAAAVVSPTVALLMRGVLRKMFLARLLTTTALMAALVLPLAGAGALGHLAPSTETPLSAPVGLAPKPFRPPAPRHSLWPVPGQTLGSTATPGKPALRLPTDANAVVLRMDRCVEAANGPRMVLTIFADGRVAAEVPDGLLSLFASDLTQYAKDRANAAEPAGTPAAPKGQVIEGRLSARELEEVLRFALHDQEFFDFDQAAVKDAIRDIYQSDGNVRDSTDATTTAFRIQTADRTHEVRWSRLGKAAWDFPKVERLLQLHAMDQRLSQVFYVLLAGGPERVEEVVAKMNELVQFYYRRYPDLPQLTAADLLKVTPSADGSQMEFLFSRNKDKKVRNALFEVVIAVPRQGEPTLRYVRPPGTSVRGWRADGVPLIED
jgi:hypothetical protein